MAQGPPTPTSPLVWREHSHNCAVAGGPSSPGFLPSLSPFKSARPVSQAEGPPCPSSLTGVSVSLALGQSCPGVRPREDQNSRCSISNFARSELNQPAPPSLPKTHLSPGLQTSSQSMAILSFHFLAATFEALVFSPLSSPAPDPAGAPSVWRDRALALSPAPAHPDCPRALLPRPPASLPPLLHLHTPRFSHLPPGSSLSPAPATHPVLLPGQTVTCFNF